MNYDQMRAALHGYVHRDDQATVDNEPVALELSLDALGRRFFPREAHAILASTVPVAGAVPLPVDFGTFEAVLYAGVELEYRSARQFLADVDAGDQVGQIYAFTIDGTRLLVPAWMTGELRATYFTRVPAITGTETNFVSERYPDVWLHAALAEQWRFVQDFEAATLTDNYWQGLADAAMNASRAGMQSGGAIRMKGR